MKKIIINTLICLIIQPAALCMKRTHEDTHNTLTIHVNKKAKKEIIQPTSIANFFINDSVFEKPIPTDDNKNNYPDSATTIPYLPNDIKNTIRTHQFFYEKEWWYNAKNYRYAHTPYGASFIDNNLAVGLNKQIIIINPNTGEILENLLHTEDLILSVTTNDNYLAYGLRNGITEVIDLTTKKTILHYVSDSAPWALSFNKNNTHLAISRKNNTLEIISIKEQKTLYSGSSEKTSYGLSFLPNNNVMYGQCNGELYTFNHQANTKNLTLTAPGNLFAQSYSNNNEKLALGLVNGTVQLINQKTNNPLMSARFNTAIYCLALDQTGKKLAIGVDDHSLHILQQFHPTPHQLMLRQLLLLWLQTKKQNKTINSIPLVLESVAKLFQLNKTELTSTWETFPTAMQNALWHTTNKMIQKHGYTPQTIEDFCFSTGTDTIKFTNLDARITSYYPNPTAKQLSLRKVIQLFFNTETIAHDICSPEELLNTISCAFKLYNAELLAIWTSFPNNVKQELWEQFNYLIKQKTQ